MTTVKPDSTVINVENNQHSTTSDHMRLTKVAEAFSISMDNIGFSVRVPKKLQPNEPKPKPFATKEFEEKVILKGVSG